MGGWGGVENFWTKVPKGTWLPKNWSTESFDVCDSSGILTIYGGEKKSTRKRPLETRVVYNAEQSFLKQRRAVISQAFTSIPVDFLVVFYKK